MRIATTAVARGSTAHATRQFIRETYGETVLRAVVDRLDASARARVDRAAMTDDLPYDTLFALWEATDSELKTRNGAWAEAAGAYAIDSLGQQLYGGLLRKASPLEFVTQSVSLFQLYYAPGNMIAVEVEAGRAVLRLIDFPAIGSLFCRRQSGGLRRAAEIAGGKEVRIAHVRCEHEGDAYCEWELRWG